MNQKVLKTLEYDKILIRLADHAYGDETKARCLSLAPMTNQEEIRLAQLQTMDAISRIIKKGRFDCSGVADLSDALDRVSIGGTLGTEELLSFCRLLAAAKHVKYFGTLDREDVPSDRTI